MKKVGILTFHRAVNYGAVLQTYALQKTCESLGASVEIIDYRCDRVEKFYYKILSTKNTWKENIKNIIFNKKQKARNTAFEQFRNEYLAQSKYPCYTKKELNKIEKMYDEFIVGSDQVWNYKCIDGDATFLLDFVSDAKKKHSYAASLGKMTADEIEKMQFSQYLSEFNSISIREKEGIKLIQSLIDGKVHLDVDPTLLLDKEDWLKASTYQESEDYLLVYSVNLPKKVMDAARMIAQEKKLKIVVITLENKYIAKNDECDASTCSPNEFLGYFANAEYVVTNSFHGTVFSIIFEKQFVTIQNSQKGLDNSRLVTLLNNVGLESRLLDTYQSCESINYNAVGKKLEKLKNESIEYLSSILND